ncbi:hypothetical protein [Arcobacter sp. s6]|uniref:hypothetical protein n=1 Tax=Arcobacter sp. s6 TaxID=3230363 RepID=UPI0034A0854B
MNETINSIFENSKLAYKKAILLGNEELEELLFSILSDSNRLLNNLNDNEINKKESSTLERTEEEEIQRVKKKIPSWLSKPNQFNYKILIAYLKLSNKNINTVHINDLENEAGLENSQKFISNFNQMKIISYKNHGKVFTEENGIITLWNPVASFIVNEYEKIIEVSEMKDKIAYEFLENSQYSNEINLSRKTGNVRYANRNKSKNVFWINPTVDNRILSDMFFILRDEKEKRIIYLKIPANTLNEEDFRIKNSNGINSFDLELSTEKNSYLIDVKSGGTRFDFKPFIFAELKL